MFNSKKKEAEKYFQNAIDDVVHKRYEEAIKNCDKAIKLNPKYAKAWRERGDAKRLLGRYNDALPDCNVAIKLDPKDWGAWCNRGALNKQLGSYEDAIQDCNEAITLMPNYGLAWYIRGEAKRNLGRHEAAILDFDESIRLDPKGCFDWCKRGQAKKCLGRHEEAILDFEEALRLSPDYQDAQESLRDAQAMQKAALIMSKNKAELICKRAEEHIKAERYAAAIKDCDEALQLDSKHARVWCARGVAKKMLGHYEEAIQDCDESIRLYQHNARPWITKCDAKRRLGRYEEAIKDCDEFITLLPNDPNPWIDQVTAKGELDRYKEAVKNSDEDIKLNPRDAIAWVTRGDAKRMLDRHDEAIRDIEEALRLYPNFKMAQKSLRDTLISQQKSVAKGGLANQLQQDIEKRKERSTPNSSLAVTQKTSNAISVKTTSPASKSTVSAAVSSSKFNQHLMSANSNNTEAQKYVERAQEHIKAKRFEAAIKDCDEAIRINPKFARAWAVRGKAKRKLSGFSTEGIASAIKDCDEAIRLDPNNSTYWLMRGKARHGNHEEAIKDLDEAIRLNPKDPKFWIARGKIKKDYISDKEAIKDFDEAIRLNPTNIKYWLIRSEARGLFGGKEAVKDMDQVIRLDPYNASHWMARGQLKRFAKDYEGALKDYDEAIRLKPNDARAWGARSDVKAKLGRFGEAFQDCEEAIRLNSIVTEAKINRTDCISKFLTPRAKYFKCDSNAVIGLINQYESSDFVKLSDEDIFCNLRDSYNYRVLIRLSMRSLCHYIRCSDIHINTLVVSQMLRNYVSLVLLVVVPNRNLLTGESLTKLAALCDKLNEQYKEIQNLVNDSSQSLNILDENNFNLVSMEESCFQRGLKTRLTLLEEISGEFEKDGIMLSKSEKMKFFEESSWIEVVKFIHENNIQLSDKVNLVKPEYADYFLLKKCMAIATYQKKNTGKITETNYPIHSDIFNKILNECALDDRLAEIVFHAFIEYCTKVKGEAIVRLKKLLEKKDFLQELNKQVMALVTLEIPNVKSIEQIANETLKKVDLMEHTYLKTPTASQLLRDLGNRHVYENNNVRPDAKVTKNEDVTSELGEVYQSMNIPKTQLRFIQVLGEGSFGVVHKGSWQPTELFDKEVAIKQLKNEKLSTRIHEDFKREIEVQSKLRSDYIVQLYGITTEQPYCMVMEFMAKGSLRDVLDTETPIQFTWELKIGVARNIASGLVYLHQHDPQIIHGDLKSLNILLNKKYQAKLADFGLATLRSETNSRSSAQTSAAKKPKGSLLWMAPELFEMNAKRRSEIDIFSFALVLWELASHLYPYESAQGNEALVKSWIVDGQRESFDERTPNTPKEYQVIVERCWKAEPSQRLTAAEALSELEKIKLFSINPHAPTLFPTAVKSAPKIPPKPKINQKTPPNSNGYLANNYVTESTPSAPSSTVPPKLAPKGYMGNVYK